LLEFNHILLIGLALSFVIQVLYHWLVFARLAYYKSQKKSKKKRPVSVIIVARNEYHNLIKTLEPILNQDYPEFEVVVVNDNSNDETHFYLEELEKSYAHLKVVQINQSLNFFSGKKFPLSIGIKSAIYDTLLHIDADCRVSSNKWIATMQSAFLAKTQIVLAYAPFKSDDGFLNKLIRFDVFMDALNYLSFALLNMPYKGVGRNLAYSKQMFYQNNGLIAQYKISYGEDDLFINQSANKINTRICIAPESFTYSVPKKNLSLWLKQKKHQLSTISLYKAKHKLLIIVYPISLYLFYALSITLLFLNSWIIVVLILLIIRISSFLRIQKIALDKLHEQKLLLLSPLLELLLFAVQAFVMALNIFNKKINGSRYSFNR
jgi:glycosyltransferase involved in cell wall biosynthesis